MAEMVHFARPKDSQAPAWRAVLAVTALVAFVIGIGAIRQAKAVDNEVTYTGTTVWNQSLDDSISGQLPLGFTFSYYGSSFTTARMSSNGVLAMGSNGTSAFGNSALSANPMPNTVFAFWDDLILNSQSAVLYTTVGTAPNRKFISQWTGMYFYSQPNVQMGTFQVILYETSNVIQIQYRNIVGTGASQGSGATIGILGPSGQYDQFLNNQSSASLVDGFTITYTPNGASSYTRSTGATYDAVYLQLSNGVATPVLSSPTDGATGVSLTPTLSWTQAANANSYKVYVSTDAQFGTLVASTPYTVNSGATTSWTTGSLSYNTTYYWRVEAVGSSSTALSSSRTFMTSAAAKISQSALMAVPSASSVSVGSTINLSSSGGSGTGAVTYAVASGSGYCSISGTVLTGTNAGTCTVTATKASDATYYSATSPAVTITVNAVVTYAVTYNGNNNTGGAVPAAGSGNANSTFTVAANSGSLVRTGYTFGGWNTLANGNGTNYAAGTGTFTLTGATTLYATWTGNSLAVTYDSQGGSSVAVGSTVSGGSIVSSPGSPTRPGYVFNGWFAASSGGSAVTFPYVHGQVADFTMYGQWLANQSGFAINAPPASLGYLNTVTLGTTGGNGTGSVSFASSTPGICSVNSGTGIVTMLASSGTCTITSTKAADATYASASASTSILASKADQAPLAVSSTTATFGQTLALTTTGGSGTGGVSWSKVSGTCTVSGSTLTPGDAGSTCVVSASKASDSNYNSVDSSDTSVSTMKAAQATVVVTSTSATFGQSLSLTATGGSGSGSVSWSKVSGTCTVSGSTLTPGDAGSACVVKATKATDTNYLEASSSNTSISVAKTTQSALTVTSTIATYGQSLTLTATGGSGLGGIDWEVVSGTCTVSGSTLTPGEAGSTCIVKATRVTDTNFLEASSVNTTVTIGRAAQSSLTVTSINVTYGDTLTLTASGGNGTGPVSWSKVSGTCTVSGSTLTPGDAGSACVIRATKAQDTNYSAKDSANTTVTIGKGTQSGLSVTSASSFTTGTPLSLVASGGQSTGALSWSVNSGSCTLSGSSLSAARGGISCVVEVTRAGDSNWLAGSVTQTITVSKIVQGLTFRSTPPSPANPGATYTVSVDSDAFLAPTVVVANQSSSVCSINAGVVSFSTVGTCLISASQAGNDVYAAAAASQSVTVVAVAASGPVATVPAASAPVVSAPVTASTVVSTPETTSPTTTTTVPVVKSAAVSNTTIPPTTTTTTTTIAVSSDPGAPNAGTDGKLPELDAGETTAIVRGEAVKADVRTDNGQLVVTLPNDVQVRIGSSSGAPGVAVVSADGVLRAFRESQVEVAAEGFQPGTTYTVFMFSKPVELARGNVAGAGTVSDVVTLPKDAKVGGHTLQVNGVGPNAEVVSVSLGIKVVAKDSNTAAAVIAISLAILLALLGGRPVFLGRSRRREHEVV